MTACPSYPHDIFTDDVLLDPYEHYRALRELGPLVWLEAHQMYVVPRYAGARAVLGDPSVFLSGQGVGLNDAINEIGAGGNTLMTDGELHDHLRGVIRPGLTPKGLRSMRESVEQIAEARVRELVERGSFDAVTDLARALPLTVVPDMIGWPEGGRDNLLTWAAASFDMLGPFNERAQRAAPLVHEMFSFAAQTAASGNLLPGSLGESILAAAGRGELEAAQVPPLIVDFLAPSLDTTISAISSAVWLLATHPEQWAALKADPSLIPNTFNEVVRMESPIRAFTRVAAVDTAIGGCELAAGARVLVLYASANRDQREFDNPDEFDITRSNADGQIGFGYGAHGCIGQALARLEGQAVLQALVAHVERIELAGGTPVRVLNNLICGWANLPVVIRPIREGSTGRMTTAVGSTHRGTA